MQEEPDPLDMALVKSIRERTGLWRQGAREIEELTRTVQEADEESIPWILCDLLGEVVENVGVLGERLHHEYGVLIDPDRGFVRDPRLPGERIGGDRLRALCEDAASYLVWFQLQNAGVEAMRAAEARHESRTSRWRQGLLAMCEKWVDVQVTAIACGLLRSPLEDQRTDAVLLLAGWADKHIRLFRRLRTALGAEGRSPGIAKGVALPPAVLIAWSEWHPNQPLTGRRSVVSRVVAELESTGNESDSARASPEDCPAPAEEFTARVEAHDTLERLRQSAGLSPQEAEFLALHLRDASTQEIAEAMRVKPSTVRQFKFRTLKKLKEAAGV